LKADYGQLRVLLTSIYPFNADELELICTRFSVDRYKKGECILNAGTVCEHFYYVTSGIIRTYFLDNNGSEKTRLILPTCSIGTALSSFISREPSFEYIDCLETAEVLKIAYDDFDSLKAELGSWKDFYLRILEMAYVFQNKKIEDLVTLNAEDRYKKARNENPRLFQDVPGKIVASYLDMTAETLSRIRAVRN
jgi:CRP-like cAMP-binding protein